MAAEVLQKFLDQQMLDLGEDKNKFEYVTKASEDLCELLRTNVAQLPAAVSVLLGGDMAPADFTYILCDEALKKVWPTYKSRFATSPDILFRASLLQAITNLVEDKNNVYAAIVYYTAMGPLRHLPTRAESTIFKELYDTCAERVEQDAHALWSPESAPKKAEEVLTLAAIDVNALTNALVKAGSQAPAGDNPQTTASDPATWMAHFAKGAADGVRVALLAGLNDVAGKVLARADRAVAAQAEATNRKSKLVFWKMALFHRQTQQSYREMTPDHAIHRIAHDLFLQLPRLYPKAIEFFLRETVRDAIGPGLADEKLSLQTYCQSLTDNKLGVRSPHEFNAGDRISLGRAIWLVAGEKAEVAQAVAQTCLPGTASLSRADLAVEMLREYQVTALTEERVVS